jgi:hypothetical protein
VHCGRTPAFRPLALSEQQSAVVTFTRLPDTNIGCGGK